MSSTYEKGTIGTYEVTAEHATRDPSLTEGEELVFLPLNVDDAGAASGLAFTLNGPVAVTIPAEEPAPGAMPAAAPAGVNSGDWQAFQKFRAEQGQQNVSTTTSAPEQPAPAAPEQPTPAPEPTSLDLTPPDSPAPTSEGQAHQ